MRELLPLIYFLAMLASRMISVCYHAASIHEKSMETLELVNSIPVENDMPEIKQFKSFLASTKVLLTAMGYFSLTKGLILTVSLIMKDYQYR